MDKSNANIPAIPQPSFGVEGILHSIPEKKKEGTFLYVESNLERQMLINCWQAIEITENWVFMKTDPGKNGYIGSNANELNMITSKMEELPNNVGHSGFTMVWTLRQMQYIARHGEAAYKQMYLDNKKPVKANDQ